MSRVPATTTVPAALVSLFVGLVWAAVGAGCTTPAERLVAAGNVALARGDIPGALARFRQAVTDGGGPRALARLGDALFEAQRFEEAERSYVGALAAATLDGATGCHVRRALAQVHLRRGRTGRAENELGALLATTPDPDAALARAALVAARAELGTAEAALAPALDERPTRDAALYRRARLALRRGDLARAQELFGDVTERRPHDPYGPYGLALVAARQGDGERACAALARATRLRPIDRTSVALDRESAELRRLKCFGALVPPHARGRA